MAVAVAAVVVTANSSPKMFANSAKQKRIRGLSIIEQHELKEEPWFQIGVPREISLEVLRRKQPGDFLVRESSTKPGCFALSLRAPPPAPKVVHYLLLRTPRGFKIKVNVLSTLIISRCTCVSHSAISLFFCFPLLIFVGRLPFTCGICLLCWFELLGCRDVLRNLPR